MSDSLLRTDKEVSEIYRRHTETVYRVCFLYMKNKYDTEDMVQNTFLRLYRDKTAFGSFEHEKAWLIRTASNLCKDFHKSAWRKTLSLEDTQPFAPSAEFPVDETLERVLALPPKYKAALYLYYYEEYSTEEIAKMLALPPSTVRGHLRTGRRLLKMELERENFET